MQISARRKIRLIVVLVIITAVSFGAFSTFLFQKNRQAHDKATIANQIVIKIFERNFLGNDYNLTHSERAKTQWHTKQAELEDIAKHRVAAFKSPQEAELTARIRQTLAESREIFQETVSLNEADPENTNGKISEEKFARLFGRRAAKSQETISAAEKLKEINDKNAAATVRQIVLLFSITGGLFAAVLLGSLVEIWRTTNLLQKQKAQGEAILRDIGDAVFVIDKEGRIVLFNKTASKITGYSESEVLGRPYSEVLEFVDEKDKQTDGSFIKQALRGKKSHMYKGTEVRAKSGRYIPVADSAAPVLGSDNTLEGVVVVFRDITPERELERSKDEFFSIASHQLRTPLGSLRWNTEMLLMDAANLPETAIDNLLEMRSSASRALGLIDDLLNLSRIEQGRIENTPIPTDLAELSRLAVQEIKPIAREQKVKLQLDIKKQPEPIMVDPKRLREIIQNLVSNAVKYTPAKGKVTVTVDVSARQAIVSVADTGIGIPKADQRRIFSKYFRARNATGTSTEGTGLGLFIAQAYAKELGGRIRFTSKPGKGTTFYLKLPKASKRKKRSV